MTNSSATTFIEHFDSLQLDVTPACRKLTSNIHSSHDLNRPEAKRFRVKLANLNIPKIYLVKIFLDLLEAENLKSKDLADEHPVFMPADVAAVVDSPEFKSLRMKRTRLDCAEALSNLVDKCCQELHCLVPREGARN